MNDAQVHGVRYQVKDVARAAAFYTDHLGFELEHDSWRPLLHERRVDAAELCDVEERPRALDRRRRQGHGALLPQQLAQR